MNRGPQTYDVIASINLQGCPEGSVLNPMEPVSKVEKRYFSGWITPLTPWGGFGLSSGLEVTAEGKRTVLEFTDNFRGSAPARALVAGSPKLRDYTIIAEIKPLDTSYSPHHDHINCQEALIGVVFRLQTSRTFYQFGIEGQRRAVLYRRNDDEWFVLAEQAVDLPDGYVTLEVKLDGDGIRCRCDDLGVSFFCTDTVFRTGRAGLRAQGRARVASIEIAQSAAQQQRDTHRRSLAQKAEAARGEGVPDPVLVRTLDLVELGGMPVFKDFCVPGRYDVLVPGAEALRAMTADGQVLWETPLAMHRQIVFSKDHSDHGRLIYGFTGQREVNERGGIRGESMTTTRGGGLNCCT